MGGLWEKFVQPVHLLRVCRCATSWCDLDLTFGFAVVTLTYKILSGLYLGNHRVSEVDTW